MSEWILVTLASLFAGFVDSIVGGGGLILVPTLLSAFPNTPPATLLGTNKGAAVCGTAWAAAQYARRVKPNLATLLPSALFAMLGSGLGAFTLTRLPSAGLRKALPFLLLAMLIYTLITKRLGHEHRPRFAGVREAAVGAGIGCSIGFYDGFFGPGTGSLFIFLLVRVLGYDFLRASAAAKLLNTATNLAALAWFIPKGHIFWSYAAVMAVANVAGSLLGTRLALKRGAGFVRVVFLLVVSALIVRTGYDAFLR